jgi:hypothetical protein
MTDDVFFSLIEWPSHLSLTPLATNSLPHARENASGGIACASVD